MILQMVKSQDVLRKLNNGTLVEFMKDVEGSWEDKLQLVSDCFLSEFKELQSEYEYIENELKMIEGDYTSND